MKLELPNNPRCKIEITAPGGSPVVYDSWTNKQLFESVRVDLTTGQSSQTEFRFFDPNFRMIDGLTDKTGIPMAGIRIFLGYGKDLKSPVFKGLLAEVERDKSSSVFTAYDMGFLMKLIKQPGYHDKNDLAAMRELVTQHKIPGDAGGRTLYFRPPSKVKQLEPSELGSRKSHIQDEQTDWDYLLERARDAGLLVFVRQDAVFVDYPAQITAPVITLKNRQNFILQDDFDFSYKTPELNEGRPRIVTRRGRNKGGKRLDGESNADSRGREEIKLKRDVLGRHTKQKLSARAKAQKELEREHAFDGHLTTLFPPGGERLDVRNTVRVLGLGKLFSRDYIADQVSYEFAAGRINMSLDLYADII